MAIRTRNRRPARNAPVSRPKAQSKLSEIPTKFNLPNLPSSTLLIRAAWVCGLIVLSIFIRNGFDRLTYQTARAKSSMNEKRAIYISKKETYSLESKQSELSNRLSYRGLDKSITPPIKIEESAE